jgi:dTDP-4-dehydrorhamnose 3,5-epimerase
MLFTETRLKGAWLLDLELRQDSRGFFARTFCRNEFAAHGVDFAGAQANIALSYRKGTIRGLHYQAAPAAETKLIRCTAGAIFDVIVDLRPESPTYLQYTGAELTAQNRRSLLAPAGFAHGYQTLTDDAEVSYLVDQFYAPACERGVRFNDAALGIAWPLPVSEVSAKDLAWPNLPESSARPGGLAATSNGTVKENAG